MREVGAAIQYGDFAPDAKENFMPSVNDKAPFVDLSQLQQYNLAVPDFGNPCELYSVPLDGSMELFPDDPQRENMGLWSNSITDSAGKFETPVVLTLEASGQYSSQGFTLTFDTTNNIFCNSLNIKWYRNLQALDSVDFTPDNAFYFCRNQVENFDRAVITFYGMNMPYNRLKLRSIDFGYGTFFYGDQLRNVNLIQEIDPSSLEISINTVDFTLDSKTDIEYSFQTRQPLGVYFNGRLLATTFVRKSNRKGKNLWTVESEDYIGIMTDISFPGGIYKNKNSAELLKEIFATAKVPYTVSDELKDGTVTGYIPYGSCRDALMQVLVAILAVADTSNSSVVDVYRLKDDVTQTIPKSRILQGQNFSDSDNVTSVEVTAHEYTPITDVMQAYTAEESGAGTNIFVQFSEPLHSLTIRDGSILESGDNYAIINANSSSCVLTGNKYSHTTQIKTKKSPLILANAVEKTASVEKATLVSPENVDAVLEHCYDWLTKNNTTNMKIVEGKHVSDGDFAMYGSVIYGGGQYGGKTKHIVTYDQPVCVGEVITSETEYLGDITGRITKQSFNLNGGILVKEVTVQ